MTKKDYIRFADRLRGVKAELKLFKEPEHVYLRMLEELCWMFAADNPRFERVTFLGYLNGTCGPSGGKVKP